MTEEEEIEALEKKNEELRKDVAKLREELKSYIGIGGAASPMVANGSIYTSSDGITYTTNDSTNSFASNYKFYPGGSGGSST